MKTLLVMRHGKSSWDYPDLDDHDRPLKKRGRRDAPRMAQLLVDEDLVPDLIITSTAKRARRTAELVAEYSGYAGSIRETSTLYHGSIGDLIRALNDLDDEHDRVLVVGHNPDLETFVDTLTGRAERLPTAALVRIALPIAGWRELTPRTKGTLEAIWRPKELA